MTVRFTNTRFFLADKIAQEQFHHDLCAEMAEAFPQMDETFVRQDCALGRATCARPGIQTEQAIRYFFILSFHDGRLLSETEGYAEQHLRHVHKYGSAEQLPVDMHAWLTACAA